MVNTFTLTSDAYQTRYMELTCIQIPDAVNNRSTVNWTLSVLGGESSYYQTGPTTVTIAGTQVYYCKQMAWDTKTFPAAKGSVSGTIELSHDENGNLVVPLKMSTSIYTGIVKTYTGSWTLDSLTKRATIIQFSDFTDIDNPQITFSNPEEYNIGVWLEPNADGEQLCLRENISNTGNYTWELTEKERNNLRNKCRGSSCTIRAVLCSNVGEKKYSDHKNATYNMTANEATRPAVSLDVLPNNSSLPVGFSGLCIQGKSKIDVTISAEGKYGSEIAYYVGRLEDKIYRTKSFTTDAIQGSGNITVYGFATDDRGFVGTTEKTITVVAYAKPLVVPINGENAILCYRSDGNGNRVGTSTSVWVKAAISYYKIASDGVQKNHCLLQWRRKLASETWNDSVHTWNTLLDSFNTELNEYSGLLPEMVFDLQNAYTIQIRAVDDIGEKDVKTLDVPTRDVALHLGRGGKNVSIGAFCDYSEEYTFYSAWKAIFGNGIVDATDTQWATIDDIIRYRQKLGHVTVVGISSGNVELTGGTYTTVATIPEPYAPEISIPVVCHYSGEEQTRLSGYLRPNGNIELYADGSNTSYWAFSVTYPI